jgi:hypothetical protein
MDHRVCPVLLILAALTVALLRAGSASAQPTFPAPAPNPTSVATFHSIGLYWHKENAGGTKAEVTFAERLPDGTAGAPRRGLDLWYDTRNQEFRGSLVNLLPGKTYNIVITRKDAAGNVLPPEITLTSSTWREDYFEPPVEDPAYTILVPSSGVREIEIKVGGSAPNAPPPVAGKMTITLPAGRARHVLITGESENNRSVVDGAAGNCVTVNGATKVVIRWLEIVNCGRSAILLTSGATDVVIDHNIMNGWGGWGTDKYGTRTLVEYPSTDGAIHCTGGNKIIVQRNTIHEPRWSATHWGQAEIVQPGGASCPIMSL